MQTYDFSDRMPGSYIVILLPDIHERVIGFNTKAPQEIERFAKKHKNWFVAGGGDYLDCMNPGDPRYKLGKDQPYADRMDRQKVFFLRDFDWIGGEHGLYLLRGNHDDRGANWTDLTLDLWEALDIPDPPDRLKFETCNIHKSLFGSWRLLHVHPYNGALFSNAQNAEQRYRNECNSVAMKLSKYGHEDALYAVANHYHKIRIRRPSTEFKLRSFSIGLRTKAQYCAPVPKVLDPKRDDVYYYDYDDRTFASNGAIFGGYSEGHQSYVEEMGYEMTEQGYLTMTVKNGVCQGIEPVML